jgi:hypothetical protein
MNLKQLTAAALDTALSHGLDDNTVYVGFNHYSRKGLAHEGQRYEWFDLSAQVHQGGPISDCIHVQSTCPADLLAKLDAAIRLQLTPLAAVSLESLGELPENTSEISPNSSAEPLTL